MTEGTAGPERPTGPSRWQRVILRMRRWQLIRVGWVALAALLLGLALGRWSVPEGAPEARRLVEQAVEEHALEADTLWTSSSQEDQPSIAEAVPLVQEGRRLDEVATWADEWLSAYTSMLRNITEPELPALARPVQRQYVNAITLSRDAVDVLRQAARTSDPEVREALVGEVLRLRQRAEHLSQGARASLRDLEGGEGDVSEPARLPSVGEATDGQ